MKLAPLSRDIPGAREAVVVCWCGGRQMSFLVIANSVGFNPPQRVTPDGEVLGSTPLSAEVLPRAFTL